MNVCPSLYSIPITLQPIGQTGQHWPFTRTALSQLTRGQPIVVHSTEPSWKQCNTCETLQPILILTLFLWSYSQEIDDFITCICYSLSYKLWLDVHCAQQNSHTAWFEECLYHTSTDSTTKVNVTLQQQCLIRLHLRCQSLKVSKAAFWARTVNADKTVVIIFKMGTQTENIDLFYDNKKLNIVNSFTYLGVALTFNGTMNTINVNIAVWFQLIPGKALD